MLRLDPRAFPTNKKSEKFSEFWQNFQTFENSTDFSNCVPIKNYEEKCAEILPASSTKKTCQKKFQIFRKNMWILKFLNLSEKIFRTQIFS
jgi:hypothetical protein